MTLTVCPDVATAIVSEVETDKWPEIERNATLPKNRTFADILDREIHVGFEDVSFRVRIEHSRHAYSDIAFMCLSQASRKKYLWWDRSEGWSHDNPTLGSSRKTTSQKETKRFVAGILSRLPRLLDVLPLEHVPFADLQSCSETDRAMVEAELTEFGLIAPDVSKHFGSLLVAMAKYIARMREVDAIGRARIRRSNRIKTQLKSLPTGTILCSRDCSNVVVLSDDPGFAIRRPDGSLYCVADDRKLRDKLMLIDAEAIRRLPRGILTAHEAMKAMQQSRKYAEGCPDLLRDQQV